MIISPQVLDPALFKNIEIQPRKGRPGSRAKRQENFRYKNIVCAFDIETSKIPQDSVILKDGGIVNRDYIAFMYVWQFQIGLGITVLGRTWDEFVYMLRSIAYTLEDEERIVIYVHNLSYEFSYLRDMAVLGKDIDEESVFCLKARKVCKFLCMSGKIEFRCSYIHSNMSLAEWTKKLQVKHQKLSGELDYTKVRYPWTPLDPVHEIPYCVNDVQGLVECIYAEMERDGDNLYSIPLTSTGYVRRDLRKALSNKSEWIQRICPALDTYDLIKEAMRGGDTHANRFMTGKILPGPVRSFDRSSSYPDVQLNDRFPVSEFFNPKATECSWDDMHKKIRQDRAVLARISAKNLRLRDPWNPNPYIPLDKCRNVLSPVVDNGRIMEAEYLEITVTDIDLYIIEHDYIAEFDVIEWQYARYGNLPEEMKEVIRSYYKGKTELKNVPEKTVQYEKSKNLLNGIFGCSCMDPIRLTIAYRKGEYHEGATVDGEFMEGELEELKEILIDQARPVMPYQWGCWTTALARLRLRELIWLCGPRYIYCDTDSVYYTAMETDRLGPQPDFSEYNKARKEASTKNRAFATDPAGIVHYMGMVEEDEKNGPYKEFKTLGAKKYAYRDKNDKLHITISGVVKSDGADELEEAGGLKALDPGDIDREGFVFRKAGGTGIIYQDEPVGECLFEGHELYVGTGAVIVDTTYTVSYGKDYRKLIEQIEALGLWNIIFRVKMGYRIDNQE